MSTKGAPLHEQLAAWDPAGRAILPNAFERSFGRNFWDYFGTRLEPQAYALLHRRAWQFLEKLDDPDPAKRDALREIVFDSLFRDARFHPVAPGLKGAEGERANRVLDFIASDAAKYGATLVSEIECGILSQASGMREKAYRHFATARSASADDPHVRHHQGVFTVLDPERVFLTAPVKSLPLVSELVEIAQSGRSAPDGLAFFSTLNPTYFLCFAETYIKSFATHWPSPVFALTLFDASGPFLKWAAERLAQWCGETAEFHLYSQTSYARDKPAVYASARFLEAARVASDLGRDLLILDADMEARGKPHDIRGRLARMEIGLNVNDYYPGHCPWRTINASQLFFKHDSAYAADFIENTARYFVAAYDPDNSTNWWIDQNALGAAFSVVAEHDYHGASPDERRLANLGYSGLTRAAQQKHRFAGGVRERRELIAAADRFYAEERWAEFSPPASG